MNDTTGLHVLMVTGWISGRVQSVHSLELARGLLETGHEILMLSPGRDGEVGRRYQWVPMWTSPALAHPVLRPIKLGVLLARLEDWGADVVHIETTEALQSGDLVRSHLRLPAVLSVYRADRSLAPVRRLAEDGVRIIAPTAVIRQTLVNRGRVPKELIRVIPVGVPEREPESGPSMAELAGGRMPVVGTVGSLERRSGHRYFLEAAKRVLDSGTQAQFLIVGSGPEKKRLRRLVGELGIRSWVSFCDPSPEVAEQLATLDIFVMPNLDESQRPVALEAMMQGKPVVAFGVGTTFEVVVDDETGLVVPKGDSQELGNAILRLMREPGYAMRLGSRGRELVGRRFSLRGTMERIVELYRQVIREHGSVCELAGEVE